MTTAAPILTGCSVLPPMEPAVPAASNGNPKQRKRRASGRFTVLNSFVDFTFRDLCRADLVTWLVLFRDVRQGVAQTSQRSIAERGGLSVQHVNRAVRRLEAVGLLTVVKQGGFRKGANVYRVHPLKQNHVHP
jgi:hypothetical protein